MRVQKVDGALLQKKKECGLEVAKEADHQVQAMLIEKKDALCLAFLRYDSHPRIICTT